MYPARVCVCAAAAVVVAGVRAASGANVITCIRDKRDDAGKLVAFIYHDVFFAYIILYTMLAHVYAKRMRTRIGNDEGPAHGINSTVYIMYTSNSLTRSILSLSPATSIIHPFLVRARLSLAGYTISSSLSTPALYPYTLYSPSNILLEIVILRR